MTPSRTLWIASDKTRSAVPFGPDGKMGTGFSAEDIQTLTLSPDREQLLIASKLAVRIGPKDVRSFSIPSDKPGVPDPVERVASSALTPGGSILVADEKRKRVFRYDHKSQYQGPFPDAKDREVVRMLVDDEGALVFLDREEKGVRAYDEAGRLLRSIGPRGAGFELKRPVDVAIDPLRNTYVADEEAGVLVFSPQGQLLVVVGAGELKRPKALTLEPSGAVLVYDDRAQRVLRFK
jgi:sugar lactone lactonase YvrE